MSVKNILGEEYIHNNALPKDNHRIIAASFMFRKDKENGGMNIENQ